MTLKNRKAAVAAAAMRLCGAQRANITKKAHKPPRNHYIEWPVFSVIGLNCESHGEKGRTCTKYKILRGSQVFFFHFIHRAWVSTGAWHPPKFWTSPLAPADFEVHNTNWHPQSSLYVISGTLSFKFLTQALIHDFPFSPGHLLESEERFVNLFCNFSPLCGAAWWQQRLNLGWFAKKAKILYLSFSYSFKPINRILWCKVHTIMKWNRLKREKKICQFKWWMTED